MIGKGGEETGWVLRMYHTMGIGGMKDGTCETNNNFYRLMMVVDIFKQRFFRIAFFSWFFLIAIISIRCFFLNFETFGSPVADPSLVFTCCNLLVFSCRKFSLVCLALDFHTDTRSKFNPQGEPPKIGFAVVNLRGDPAAHNS